MGELGGGGVGEGVRGGLGFKEGGRRVTDGRMHSDEVGLARKAVRAGDAGAEHG